MAKAFSYLRFSSAAQAGGDSLRRQLKAATEWADTHGVELDTSLRDEGVSAYKGEHRLRGALSSFLARVDTGDVQPGDYFLIESFDRLTRENESVAINLLTSLTLKGVKVVTLVDGEVYDQDASVTDLLRAMIVMSRAHEENKARSVRLAAAWAEKKRRARETGEILTRRGPAWVRFVEGERRFEIIGDRAQIVRRIFDECNDGLGITAIASRLNAEGVAPFVENSDGWHQGYVLTILRSPTVCGYYQPTLTTPRPGQRMQRVSDGDPIPNYYPRIIPDETFDRAQEMIASRNKRGGGKGRRGKTFSNLLIGLGRCEECGGTLILGSRHNSTAVRHFRCYQQSRAHVCENRRRYLATDVERRLMAFLYSRKLREETPVHDQGLSIKMAQVADVKAKIETLLDAVEGGSTSLAERLRQREIELVQLEREADDIRLKVSARNRVDASEAGWEAFTWLDSVAGKEGLADADLYHARAKANALLCQVAEWIMPTESAVWLKTHDGTLYRWESDVTMTAIVGPEFAVPFDLNHPRFREPAFDEKKGRYVEGFNLKGRAVKGA